MDSAKCAKCGNEFPVSGMTRLDGQRYCAICGEQVMEDLQKPEPLQAAPVADGCIVCGMGGPFQNVGGAAVCTGCAEKVYNRPFPGWLKSSLVVSVVLLVFALAHGAKYFRTGRELYRGENAVRAARFEDAAKALKPVVAFAPECKKCALLYAKAALQLGDPNEAYEATNGKNFDDDELFEEVKGAFARFDRAAKMLDDAEKQADAGDEVAALKSLEAAKQEYPQLRSYDSFESGIRISAAFVRKDYDKFLELEQLEAKGHPESPVAQAGVASALACKYAVTGDAKYAQDAKAALELSRNLTGTDAESQTGFKEYAERIEYRLKTREIINKAEYDRRFRPELAKKESN